MQFFMDLHTCLNGEWSQLGEQKLCDCSIQASPMQTLATLVLTVLDKLPLTDVFRIEALALADIMVAHGHSVATASTDHQPLKQSWPFSGRTMATIFSMRLAIVT